MVELVWLLKDEISNLLKCESADTKMSYKFLTVVLGKEEKFHIPEKDINFTGRKKKYGVETRIKLGWMVSPSESCQNAQAKWSFNLKWAEKKWATVSSISKNLLRAGKIMWVEKVKCCHSM